MHVSSIYFFPKDRKRKRNAGENKGGLFHSSGVIFPVLFTHDCTGKVGSLLPTRIIIKSSAPFFSLYIHAVISIFSVLDNLIYFDLS